MGPKGMSAFVHLVAMGANEGVLNMLGLDMVLNVVLPMLVVATHCA